MLRRDVLPVLAAGSTALAAPQRTRIGCQSRSYYAPVKGLTKLMSALDDMAAAGFDGFETNQLCLAETFENPEPMKAEFAKRKIELFGLHLGVRVHEANGLEKAKADVSRVAKGVRALGGSFLVASPAAARGLEGAELQAYFHRKATALAELGKVCRDQGVTLGVHNHLEETRRGWAEFRVLAEKSRPTDFSFVADLGPSGLTGEDPAAFLTDYHHRVAGLHVRDYKGEKQTALGTGSVNLMGAAQALHKRGWKGWVIVELEADGIAGYTKEQAVRQAREFVRTKMKF